MKTALIQPIERIKLTEWVKLTRWQRVIVVFGFVTVVFIGGTTGHVLFSPSSAAAAVHALRPSGLVIWFVFGLIFSPFFVRRRVKS